MMIHLIDTPRAAGLPVPSTSRETSLPVRASVNWRLHASWATDEAEVHAAQALRYQVFGVEFGAQLPATAHAVGRDIDRFDAYCNHLLVWATDRNARHEPQLVGTYRVLTPDAAARLGGLYADLAFELSALAPLRSRMVELGRACVHPQWRSGGVIMALWSALGRFMAQHRFETMVGCASVGLTDGGQFASALWNTFEHSYLAEPQWRVSPHMPLALAAPDALQTPVSLRAMPPLIKGYLRGGARVLGPPAYDASFNTADVPIMLRIAALTPRYRSQFFQL